MQPLEIVTMHAFRGPKRACKLDTREATTYVPGMLHGDKQAQALAPVTDRDEKP